MKYNILRLVGTVGACRAGGAARHVRLANRPGMAGIVPELTQGVLCPGRGSFYPRNVNIDHRAWVYGCLLMSIITYCILYCVCQSHTT